MPGSSARSMASSWPAPSTSIAAGSTQFPTLRHPRSLHVAGGGARLGKVRRGGQRDAGSIHHPTTMMLVAAGKHVFCEKPLADNYLKAKRDGRRRGAGRPHQHGQPDLPQRRRAAEGARDRAGRRRRRGQARRGVLPAELAGFQVLGRLAHRSEMAVAAVAQPRLQRRAGRHRHPYPRFRDLWRRRSTSTMCSAG